MESNQVVIPLDVIDEDELIEFVDRIKTLTHADVKIHRQFILTSDSPSVQSGLEFLFGEMLAKPEYQNPVSQRKAKKKRPEPTLKIKKIMGGGAV